MEHFRKIHFIGIGGIGISSLAYLSLAEGKRVTGSDATGSALTDDLMEEGADIYIGHNADNVTDDTELAIYTEAIDQENNPEFLRAKEMGIPVLSYFEALGQIARTKKTIAVVGTHGKTTTTAMLGLALIDAGFDPLVIVGSKVRKFNGRNINIGKGDVFVAEACEYRRSFLSIAPFGVVFLNCEAEHLDYYKDEADYISAYKELIEQIPVDGFLVANMEDKNVRKIAKNCAGRIIPVTMKDADELDLHMQVMGDFNRLNATQAFWAAEALGADVEKTRDSLEHFTGTWRRMEVKGEFNGALLLDDYGHHPTEVFSTLQAIKNKYPDKNLICVFQPHQYSRTHLLINEFKRAFEYADKLIITDIYAARDTDEDMAKIDEERLVKILRDSGVD
ncbi:MAG TPA: Mur ligase domain-containing protein, partial [Methylococcales bacterium]